MSNYERLIVEVSDGVARITLNRPERLNAIDEVMKREIGLALDRIESDARVGAVVVTGAGRAFCSGMDLKDDATADIKRVEGWRRALSRDLAFLIRFWDFPKPTIAAIHGHCLAAGFELAMCCDVTIAEEGTMLGEPELLFGSVVTAMIMPWLVGPKHTKELLLSADDKVGAERAAAIGLVNRVVAKGTHLEEAMTLARRMAALDADGVRMTKEAINRTFEIMGLREALRANLDLAIQIESLDTPSRRTFREITQREGLKAALAWRERKAGGGQ